MSKILFAKILQYGIYFDKKRGQWVTVEATKYNEETNEPILWAVRKGYFVMSKITGQFEYEPMPSSRDEDFLKEFRFDTAKEAAECWSNYHE